MSVTSVEQIVWSERYGYAGTLDWLGVVEHEGRRLCVLGDWKTSKGIWPEMLLQNAAYVQAAVEMGVAEEPLAGCIVRLPKVATDPGLEVRIIPAEAQAELFQAFLAVLALWRWTDQQASRP